MRLAVIIPIYNEEATLEKLCAAVSNRPPPVDPATGQPLDRIVILIDDGSTDGSARVIGSLVKQDDVYSVKHPRNMGKGAGVASGLAEARRLEVDIAIIQDADLEYDPADHNVVLGPILDGRADAVIGSRFLGQTHRVLYFWHYLANRFITLLSNCLTNLNLSDIECCLKAFNKDVLSKLKIEESRFGLEPEIVARLAHMRSESDQPMRIYEVPVSYSGRTYAEGKKITWRDGVSALRCILLYNTIRRR